MKSRLFSYTMVLVLFLALGVSGVRADYGVANGQPLAPMGQGFTYQGKLNDSAGSPIDGACDFQFILYDAVTGGEQIGPTQEKTNISVTNGYFITGLDFGSSAFLGEARWLAVAVRCPVGSGSYTPLSPRQALTPAPYALDADLLDGQHSTAFSTASHNHWMGSWTGAGTGLTLSGGTIGLQASGSTYGIYGTSNSTTGAAGYFSNTSGSVTNRGWGVRAFTGSGVPGDLLPANFYHGAGEFAGPNGVIGAASSDASTGYGVTGISAGSNGRGVYGYSTSSSGYTYGVYGESASTDGTGVLGFATATSGVPSGVYGLSASTTGMGVRGIASATSGYNYGVSGSSASTSGTGIYGSATATSGTTYGMYGRSASTSGTGVTGYSSATSGTTNGLVGRSDSTSGTGVTGYSSATTGSTYGVYGQSDSTTGNGVYGYATDINGSASGVVGISNSNSGFGVKGWADNGNAALATGVYGRTDSNNGFGVAGYNYFSGVGVGAWSNNGNPITAYHGDFPGGSLEFYVTGAGNVYANGTYNSFKTSSLDGETHATSSIQSTEAWVEDFGHGELVDGKAVVTIAPDFAGMANLSMDYMVFITLEGDCQGVFITNKTPTTFEVHELNGGTSRVLFGYRIVAKPAGSETVRLPEVTIPDPVEVERQPDDATQPLNPPQPPQLPEPLGQGQLPDQVQP